MRQTQVSLGAAGASAPFPVDAQSVPFAIGLGFIPSNGADLTGKVQHSFDSPHQLHLVSVTRSGTTATVVDTGPDGNGHGLIAGDSVTISNTGSTVLDGHYQVVTITDANTYTYTVANSGATADNGVTQAARFRWFDHASMVGMTDREDGNYAFPVQAIRLLVSDYVSGRADLLFSQGIGR